MTHPDNLTSQERPKNDVQCAEALNQLPGALTSASSTGTALPHEVYGLNAPQPPTPSPSTPIESDELDSILTRLSADIISVDDAKAAIQAQVDEAVRKALQTVADKGKTWREPNEGTVYELNKAIEQLTTKSKDSKEK